MDHQKSGVAWLQKLFAHAPKACRGALLADDMGLGKTLQLLCFIAAAREADPNLPPALVVAPLSLLENWKEEVEQFFQPGSLRLLTAYGSNLADLRVPQSIIDEQLRKEGLVRFLKPGWRNGVDIVLTTYETLRDMEFSFARESWSIMVCDEAQKIKNPAANLTKAAKKQQTIFRIACTGTPVENSLVDLWCLFDFVQPGLLGALNEFGRDYRRPIETESDDERQKVEELRELVSPQILRRMKVDVAKDLKAKIVDQNCQRLSLSNHQRSLYSNAVDLYRRRSDPDVASPFKNYLGLLHYFRLVCTDPQRPGLGVFAPESLSDYRSKAPKLDWLMTALEHIRKREEKVIVFCEFKNIQRLLRHYIQAAFDISPDIINGDTSASAENVDSRQKRIKAFQQKPGFGIIILSPVAVGFGVNIQAANHVIHYTRTWNPAKEDQATDRAYRIGQTRDVYVYYPIVRAEDFKTFDVKLDELLSRKRSLAGDMLNGAGDIAARDFDLGELSPEGSGSFRDELVTLDDVFRMDPITFESFAAALWSAQGWRMVTRTQRNADGGVDVYARNENRGVLIQCKSTSSDRPLNWSAIQEIVTGQAIYKRLYPSVDFDLVCFTNGEFNAYAREQASVIGVELVERGNIETMLLKSPIRFSNIEKFTLDI
jgi:SNF2 family DNA or RNA helicase/Holliday junction resolvase-like predicted endonuclease